MKIRKKPNQYQKLKKKKEEVKEVNQKKNASDLAKSSLDTARKTEKTATTLLESITSSPHADDGK